MTTPNYDINYNDKRFTEVETDKKAALNEIDVTYGNMISSSDKFYQAQIDASKEWADKQTQLQQEQTDFAIEQINQQKAQAKQDYTKEQSGAYVDWQKQSNQYGANAEQMAAQGMAGSGYSESSQVSMYNTYQNRVATARESYNRAVLNYDNAIKDARLQNNAALAEIAYNALQTQLELSLEGFQYKNTLIIEQANKKREVDNIYHQRYQDVLAQINTENAQAEEVRQFNERIEFESTQAELDRKFKAEQAKLDKQHDKDMLAAQTKAEKEKIEKEYAEKKKYLDQQLANEKALLSYQNSLKNNSAAIVKSGGGSGGSRSSGKTSTGRGKSGITAVNKGSGEHSGSVGSKKTSSNNNIDMASVLALGYGPISASRLNQLVKQGLVEEYKSGGKTKFRKSSYTNKQKNLFNLMG